MTTFRTELKLGERYRDKATGFEGTCTNIAFFQHGCERCTLKGFNKQGEIVEYGFDAPEVEWLNPKTAEPEPVKLIERKVGGPHGSAPMLRR